MNARKAFVANYKRKLKEISSDLAVPFDRVCPLPLLICHQSLLFNHTNSICHEIQQRSGAASQPTKAQLYQDAIARDNDNFINQQEQTQDVRLSKRK